MLPLLGGGSVFDDSDISEIKIMVIVDAYFFRDHYGLWLIQSFHVWSSKLQTIETKKSLLIYSLYLHSIFFNLKLQGSGFFPLRFEQPDFSVLIEFFYFLKQFYQRMAYKDFLEYS